MSTNNDHEYRQHKAGITCMVPIVILITALVVGLVIMCNEGSSFTKNSTFIDQNRNGDFECTLRWNEMTMYAIVPNSDMRIYKSRVGSHIDKDVLRQENIKVLVNEFRLDTIVVHRNNLFSGANKKSDAYVTMKKMFGFVYQIDDRRPRSITELDGHIDRCEDHYLGQMINGKPDGYGKKFTGYYYRGKAITKTGPFHRVKTQLGLWKEGKPVHIRSCTTVLGHAKEPDTEYLYSVDQDDYSLFPPDVSQVEFYMLKDSSFIYNDTHITKTDPIYKEFMRMKSTIDNMIDWGGMRWDSFELLDKYIALRRLFNKRKKNLGHDQLYMRTM